MVKDYYKFFSDVAPRSQFWLHNGRPVKNLSELLAVLKYMDDDLFSFHVNANKNDFALWIRDVIDNHLGQELVPVRDKEHIISIIEGRLSPGEAKKYPSLKKLEITETDIPKPSSVEEQLDEILKKEREIEARERIIQSIEARIENKLGKEKRGFFSKEFIEGLLIGILILLICGLIYIKFFMPY